MPPKNSEPPSLATLSLSDDQPLSSAFAPPLSLLETLFTALTAPPPPFSTASPPLLPILDVRHDLIGLTTLLGKEATALALAYKPPVSKPAVLGTLEKVLGLLRKLEYATLNAPRQGCLGKELKFVSSMITMIFFRYRQVDVC